MSLDEVLQMRSHNRISALQEEMPESLFSLSVCMQGHKEEMLT